MLIRQRSRHNKELRKCAHLTNCLTPLSGVKSSKSASLRTLERTVLDYLHYHHEKSPRHQWLSLWRQDIPLHLVGGEGKGFVSFGAERTGGSLISRCTSV
ncbi:hypothetical protein AVEN_192305-1 [Araneus ventricosus]|uniref:Uncharacterized protein n=1 Tax=Araneus ventricosus TaxID=182803 RepID=A0A4Y2JPV9_ARAVE|nr:hypothetical protein AVEN_192305-1 [Araneus ventricosus]